MPAKAHAPRWLRREGKLGGFLSRFHMRTLVLALGDEGCVPCVPWNGKCMR